MFCSRGPTLSLELALENTSWSSVDLFHGGRVRATPGTDLHLLPSGRVEVYDLYGYSGQCNFEDLENPMR